MNLRIKLKIQNTKSKHKIKVNVQTSLKRKLPKIKNRGKRSLLSTKNKGYE